MAKSKGRIGSSLNFILIIFAIKKIKENDDNKVKDSQYLLVIDSKNLNIKNKRKIVMIPNFSAVFLFINPVGRLMNKIEIPTIIPQIISAKSEGQCLLK